MESDVVSSLLAVVEHAGPTGLMAIAIYWLVKEAKRKDRDVREAHERCQQEVSAMRASYIADTKVYTEKFSAAFAANTEAFQNHAETHQRLIDALTSRYRRKNDDPEGETTALIRTVTEGESHGRHYRTPRP